MFATDKRIKKSYLRIIKNFKKDNLLNIELCTIAI